MKQEKISVIVPVYKVEPYLRKCLDSIVNQTYQNLEIILIDDGSPDHCGAICDEYAVNDERIKVIHQPNAGLSSARNAGLVEATGEYIGFVDSDDWIDLNMYEYLLSNALSENADICICGRYEEYSTKTITKGYPKQEVLDTEAALLVLLRNNFIQNFVWDKLWRRKLFEDVYFPEGRTYEDIAIVHRLFERAEKVQCLPNAKYHYLQRTDSIIGDTSLKNKMNHYMAAKQRYSEMVEKWPQFRPLLEGQCVASAIGIWCSWLDNPGTERKQHQEEVRKISAFAKGHGKDARHHISIGLAGRLVSHLLNYPAWWSFAIAYCVGKLYQKKNGRAL